MLTLPYEFYRADQAGFLAELDAWMKLEPWELPEGEETVNDAWAPAALGMAKLVNKIPMPIKQAVREQLGAGAHPAELISKASKKLGLGGKADKAMPEAMRGALMRMHASSNRKLCERLDGRLAPYGYYGGAQDEGPE